MLESFVGHSKHSIHLTPSDATCSQLPPFHHYTDFLSSCCAATCCVRATAKRTRTRRRACCLAFRGSLLPCLYSCACSCLLALLRLLSLAHPLSSLICANAASALSSCLPCPHTRCQLGVPVTVRTSALLHVPWFSHTLFNLISPLPPTSLIP